MLFGLVRPLFDGGRGRVGPVCLGRRVREGGDGPVEGVLRVDPQPALEGFVDERRRVVELGPVEVGGDPLEVRPCLVQVGDTGGGAGSRGVGVGCRDVAGAGPRCHLVGAPPVRRRARQRAVRVEGPDAEAFRAPGDEFDRVALGAGGA